MKKIEKAVSYREKIYQSIKDEIINGNFLPGQMLNERKLAESLNVSRTPIREAFQMLETEGWVSIEPWRGVFVKPIAIEDLTEIFSARRIIECRIAEEIIGKITEENLRELEMLISGQRNLRHPDQLSEYAQFDQQFHIKMASFTENRILIRWIEDLSDMVRRITVLLLREMEHRFDEAVVEHRAIIKALRDGDKVAVSEKMREHLEAGERNFIHVLTGRGVTKLNG